MKEGYSKAVVIQQSSKLFNSMKELCVHRSFKSCEALFRAIMRHNLYMMAKRYFTEMLSERIEHNRHTCKLYESLGHASKMFNETPHLTISFLNATLGRYYSDS